LDDANTVGHYSEQIALSAANGFEKGKTYTIRVRAVVGGVAGCCVRTFQLEAEVDANTVTPTVTANVTQIEGTDATDQLATALAAGLNAAIPGSPTADSINERVKAIDLLTEASGSGDLAAVKTRAILALPAYAPGVEHGLGVLDANANLPADVKRWLTVAPVALSSQFVQAIVADYASGKAPLQPTTAGRTLDVAATGEAGVDLDNIHAASAPTTLTNITVPTVTDVTNGVKVSVGTGAGQVNVASGKVPATVAHSDGVDAAALVTTVGVAGAGLTALASATALTSAVSTIRGADSDTLKTLSDEIATRMATFTYTTPPTAIENADALLKRDWTSVTGEAARSVLNALRFLRNKWGAPGGVLTVTKEDDATTAWTGTLSTDAAAEPVTGVDPS
jgi:hypothetical protein